MIKTTKKELMEAASLLMSVCLGMGVKCKECPFDTLYGCMLEGENPTHWSPIIKTEEVEFIDE